MDRLPSEIILHIISFLNPKEIVTIQSVSRRFLSLTRDNGLWKGKCFEESYHERRRRRQRDLAASDSRYAPLLQAMLDLARPQSPMVSAEPGAPNSEMQSHRMAARERLRVVANWDPSYPDEQINYYEEYIHRHAPISTNWFETVKDGTGEEKEQREATGMGILYNQASSYAEKLVGAMDDGSICLWDLRHAAGQGRVIARSRSCLLTGSSTQLDREQNIAQSKVQMTETGAVECVSIDSFSKRGYFAVMNALVEVDLNNLQVVSREQYPFPITALSEAKNSVPLTVGTNMTLHLYDRRSRSAQFIDNSNSVRCELIGGQPRNDFHRLLNGNVRRNHATLSQPGPLSILHLPEDRDWDGNGSIWVTGRFTSLLNYDRRYFPRLRGSLHSGARISCLRVAHHPFLPRELGLMRDNALSISTIQTMKSMQGHTLLAAGEYKGKGSLELYGLSSDPAYTSFSTDASLSHLKGTSFQNRQTASSSKLLSVASHGGKMVFSDGNGNVKWVERDGFSPIRTWNINGPEFGNSNLEHRQSAEAQTPPDDIVQLLLPTNPDSTFGHNAIGSDNLVMWTGEGRLGLLSFGKEMWDWSTLEDEAMAYEERCRRKAEREYAGVMGRALRKQADELNFVRNLGFGVP